MRLSWLFLIMFISLLGGCSKGSSGPTSAEGKWTYTTADSKITVTFELIKNSAGSLDIQNQSFKLNGTVYNSFAQISGVSLPVIASMRINANDAAITYPYHILFTNSTMSGDFKTINVVEGDYTFPGGTGTLNAIVIIRP